MATSREGKDAALEDEKVNYRRMRNPDEYANKDEREAEDDFLAPARWWFVTTLFPLMSGTFGPVATAFSICALTQDWRLIADASSDEQAGTFVRDPSWLIAVNAVALAVALITNLGMLLQMAEKVPYPIAAPLVVFGWYTSSFLLLGIVAAAYPDLPLPPAEPRTFSQAYYYAAMAAVLYFMIGTMLLVTAIGVWKGGYAKKFKLTTAQRTLMLQTIVFLGYWLAAAAVYARIEGWTYLDSVYWTIVTLFTIGFGDYAPTTHLGRGLLFPMALGGILFVGLIIGSIRTLVLQGGSTKVSRRILERTRESALASLDHDGKNIRIGFFHKHDAGKNVTTELEIRQQEFELMRKVRARAQRTNQMIALGVSAGAWFFLWIIGALVFWRASQGTSDWSYFEAIYFAYVAFVTIGYGDFEPDNEALKPAFVLWALLALPTLTLLIGAIGDNMSDAINTAALTIAEAPLLKGSTLQRGAIKAKKGVGSQHMDSKPAGFMEDEHEGVDHSRFDDKAHAEIAHSVALDFHHPKGEESRKEIHEHRAKARRYRGFLLFKAVKEVMTHLDASPPRKYTFEEWCWFLKILGEDEKDPKNHRRLHMVKHEQEHHGEGTGIGQAGHMGADPELLTPWSWLGPRSPLMSSADEPKWLLERLMSALETELYNKEKELARREQEDEQDGKRVSISSEESETADIPSDEPSFDRD